MIISTLLFYLFDLINIEFSHNKWCLIMTFHNNENTLLHIAHEYIFYEKIMTCILRLISSNTIQSIHIFPILGLHHE